MNNPPENIINQIMFYNSHPIADILKASSFLKALEMNNGYRTHGSPFDRGDMDAYSGRGYEPHKTKRRLGRMVQIKLETDEELKEFEASYFHASDRTFGVNSVQTIIKAKYGYTMVFWIRPMWTLTREEQYHEDNRPSEFEDSDSNSD